MAPTAHDARRRLDPAVLLSILSAVVLCGVAIVRAISEFHPGRFDGYWFGFLQRRAYDGTLWSSLNVQWFKILFIPATIAFLYLAVRWQNYAHAKGSHRLMVLEPFLIPPIFIAANVVEIYKYVSTRSGGRLVFLTGENPWVNVVVHLLSALLAYAYLKSLSMGPLFHRRDRAR